MVNEPNKGAQTEAENILTIELLNRIVIYRISAIIVARRAKKWIRKSGFLYGNLI